MGNDTLRIAILHTGNVGGPLLTDVIVRMREVLRTALNADAHGLTISCRPIGTRPIPIPGVAYNRVTGKYSVEPFFNLAAKMRPRAEQKLATKGQKISKVLVITDVPLFSYVHNSDVFGEADVGGSIAVVSTAPLNIDATIDEFKKRVIKECIHEVGHTLGLGHCADKTCVMSLSSDRFDVDRKSEHLCPQCMSKLESLVYKDYRTWDHE